jgi:hypothetical protein
MFKNTVLIILFNYSNCTKNKDFIKKLYGDKFKKIIFYSDLPNSDDDDEINYIYVNRGIYGPKIFDHFYENYKDLILNSDGLFYLMDDCIINLNHLNEYSNEKIIYQHHSQFLSINELNGWWWDKEYGKPKIYSLESDVDFKKYNINGYIGSFSDCFYLPKKYLTEKLFDLFKIFNKHEMFLEITIPTIINMIEPNIDNYHKYNIYFNYDNYNNMGKKYLIEYFSDKNNLVAHPIKFNQNPENKNWLTEIFNLEN